MSGQLMTNPGVASGDQDSFGSNVILGLANHGPEKVREKADNHRPDHQELDEQHVFGVLHVDVSLHFAGIFGGLHWHRTHDGFVRRPQLETAHQGT